jgi:hypothetical protein
VYVTLGVATTLECLEQPENNKPTNAAMNNDVQCFINVNDA